jgi:ABC-type multidrug transport system fused ATPase/permease subunit
MGNLKKILLLLNPQLKLKFFLLIFLVICNTLLEMVSVSLLIPLINILTGTLDSTIIFLEENKLSFLIQFLEIKKILLIFGGVYVFKIFFRLYLVHYQNDFIFSFFTILLNRLYKKYIFKDYFFHTKNNSAILIRNLTSEIHQCSVGFMGSITNIILEFIIIAGLLLVLISYKPIVVVVFSAVVGFISVILIVFLNKKSKSLGLDRQKFSLINVNYIMQSLGGIKEIKVNLKENAITKKFFLNSLNVKKTNYLFQVLQQMPKLILELIVIISIVWLLFYLIKSGMPSSEIITFFALLIGIFSRVMPSIYKLSASYINLSYYKSSVDLLFNEINYKSYKKLKNNNDENQKNINAIEFKKEIEIKDIHFTYPETDKEIFTNTNFIIKKGEKIGIYGESGSGKSTMVDLIIGLLNPSSGKILVDGKDINLNKSSWFSKIGYVPQNVFLNDDDIKSNIIFYEDEDKINLARYNESIKISQLENLVSDSASKEFANIGERGSQLSGGQRQRIGLARSLYKNSEILIFDEATNALDEKNERNFINHIYSLRSDKTFIIISHKKSILEKCDRLLTVKNNKIIEA